MNSALQLLRERLEAFHQGQGGAVAMMMMAAAIIIFLTSLLILDAGYMARDRIAVQAAADVASFSQASVEARAMNMIAFANVGKRITFGVTSFYIALWIAYAEVAVIVGIVLGICIAAAIATFGATSGLCPPIAKFLAKLLAVMAKEAPDLGKLEGSLNRTYFKKDMEGFSAYQKYMIGMVPWWGFSEALVRSMRNGATSAISWPPPKKIGGFGSKLNANELGMPVRRAAHNTGSFSGGSAGGIGYGGLCAMTMKGGLISDRVAHGIEYAARSLQYHKSEVAAVIPVVLLLAPLQIALGCEAQRGPMGREGSPYEVKTFGRNADWLRASSHLTFAYRKTDADMGALSDNYQVANAKGKKGFNLDVNGVWTMSRAEMSYQGSEAPNLWYSSWTARMRPVALPDEWQIHGRNKANIHEAYLDIVAYSAIAAAVGGQTDIQSLAFDAAHMLNAVHNLRGLENGIAK